MTKLAVAGGLKIAVLLPCHNEAQTIGAVVRGFAQALPGAGIYVFDNNSTDDTARAAAHAGARVFRETRPGKRNVVRRMFADIDADVFVMADGDGSSDPADAPSLVNALVTEHVDMVVGVRSDAGRKADGSAQARGLERAYRWVFGRGCNDLSSGYRAFTRRFVKSFPAVSSGFGIEAEMSVHAGQLMIPVAEIELSSGGSPQASTKPEKRRGDSSGLPMLARLIRETRPFLFYGAVAMLFWTAGLAMFLPILATWLDTGVVAWLPNAVAATGLLVIGLVLAACGLVLDSLSRSRVEQKRILFLTVPALSNGASAG